MKKVISLVLLSAVILSVFISCDADAIRDTASVMTKTGVNVVNPQGYEDAAESAICMADLYMDTTLSDDVRELYYEVMISDVNSACYTSDGKDYLLSQIHTQSVYSLDTLKTTYNTKVTALSSAVTNIIGSNDEETTAAFHEMFDMLWEDYVETLRDLLGIDSTDTYASYYEVVLHGAVCHLLDTATKCITDGVSADLSEILEVVNPIIAGVKAIDNLGDLGIFEALSNIVYTVAD